MRRVLFTILVISALGSCLPEVWGQESSAEELWRPSVFFEALDEARSALVEKVYGTKIGSETTLLEHVQRNPEEIMAIESVLTNVIVSNQVFNEEEGSVYVAVRVPVDAFPYPYRNYFVSSGEYLTAEGTSTAKPLAARACEVEDFGWSDGALSATGEWLKPKEMSIEEAAKSGFRAARADAMRNLAEKVENIRTDKQTVGQYVKDSEVLREKVQLFIQRNVTEQEDTYAFADVFQVSLLLPLAGLPDALDLKTKFPVSTYCPPTAQEKVLARQRAQQNAFEKLAEAVYEVPMKKYGTVADYVFSKPGYEKKIEAILREATIVREVTFDDGTSQVEVQFKTGKLPWRIRGACKKVLGKTFSVIGEGGTP